VTLRQNQLVIAIINNHTRTNDDHMWGEWIWSRRPSENWSFLSSCHMSQIGLLFFQNRLLNKVLMFAYNIKDISILQMKLLDQSKSIKQYIDSKNLT
jgi:hypothetical protein